MTEISKLNSSRDKKLEKLLEQSLKKYNNSSNDIEKFRYKLIIDEISEFENEKALKSCGKLNKSLGFAYYIENYRDFELGLNYFATKLINEILYYKENTEVLIHDSYDSYSSFQNNNPRVFLIDIISKYDEELSKYIQINSSENNSLDSFISYIRTNWKDYEGEKSEYNQLISKLDSYFDEHSQKCKCSRADIFIYLFSKNNMIDVFKKYYVMEDTSEEELEKLIKENDIYMKISTIDDINLIAEMDRIIKRSLNNKVQRLKF